MSRGDRPGRWNGLLPRRSQQKQRPIGEIKRVWTARTRSGLNSLAIGMMRWWNAARYSGSPIRSSVVSCERVGGLLGLSLCLSQVMLTLRPTPAPAPTLYGEPVNGSELV